MNTLKRKTYIALTLIGITYLLLLTVRWMLISSYEYPSIQLIIQNQGPSAMNDTTVELWQISQSIGTIPAGARIEIPLKPIGESAAIIHYQNDQNEKITLPGLGYLFPGCSGTISVLVKEDTIRSSQSNVQFPSFWHHVVEMIVGSDRLLHAR